MQKKIFGHQMVLLQSGGLITAGSCIFTWHWLYVLGISWQFGDAWGQVPCIPLPSAAAAKRVQRDFFPQGKEKTGPPI